MPSFVNPDGSFFNETYGAPVSRIRALSGATVRLRASDRLVLVEAGLLSALTIWLPPGPRPGELVEISFEADIGTLSLCDATGGSIASAPTEAAGPGGTIYMRYIDDRYGWFYWNGVLLASSQAHPVKGLYLQVLPSDPPAGPGPGIVRVYAVESATAGQAELRVQAGTGAASVPFVVDVGSGV